MCSSNLLDSPFLKENLPNEISKYKELINKIVTSIGKAKKLTEICLGDFDPANFNKFNTLKSELLV